MLLQMLKGKPDVKQWFIDTLKVTDMHDGAPAVRQLHDNPVTASTSVAKYLDGAFNNPDTYPDAILTIKGQQILVHKLVVAKGCKVLARAWDPHWASSKPIAMDESLSCEACSVHPSYEAARLFLDYFYTGEVKWAGSKAELSSALQLLVMACMYDVPHLVCIVEMALLSKLDFNNCCNMLAVADHHQAEQLKARCMHYIRKGHHLLKASDSYKQLSPELQADIEAGLQS